MSTPNTRRDVLRIGASALAAGSLAGCLGGDAANGSDADDGGSSAATASFAVVGDFASAVAGDAASVSTLVPVGQHGHGWSPSPRVHREVLESDLFVYVAEGFQPWADDIVANVRNGGTGVTAVAAREGVDLLGGNGSHDHGHESEDEHGHEHGTVDPHFWLDPDRSKRAVENVREGFVEVDGENAGTYEDNAAAYARRLDELDEAFASALSDAPKDVVLVAGHNAFRYLGSTYGFEIRALTGISPDDQPTPKDIARAQEIIDEHDIEYILAPALESDRAATQLVNETDAKDHLPITSIAGMKEEWQKRNWSYVDLMENVNLPSLKRALGAQ